MAAHKDCTTPRADLEAAYRRTTYRVRTACGPIDIRIGVRNGALDRVLDEHQVSEWAFVTASNPGSRPNSDDDNARRNAELETVLRKGGRQFLPGSGVPDMSGWQPECSYLVLGVDKPDAIVMAKRWGQCAVVWGTRGGTPELVWAD